MVTAASGPSSCSIAPTFPDSTDRMLRSRGRSVATVTSVALTTSRTSLPGVPAGPTSQMVPPGCAISVSPNSGFMPTIRPVTTEERANRLSSAWTRRGPNTSSTGPVAMTWPPLNTTTGAASRATSSIECDT